MKAIVESYLDLSKPPNTAKKKILRCEILRILEHMHS